MPTDRERYGVTRRGLLAGGASLAALASVPAAAQQPAAPNSRRFALAYIGTYTPHAVHGAAGHGEGIYLMRLDRATGALEPVKTYAAPSPSWITLAPDRRFLYAINEIEDFGGAKHGSVTAYRIAPGSGELTQINAVSSQGAGPAQGSVHPSGKFVFVANYGGGNVAVLPVEPDGGLGDAVDVQADQGPPGAGRPADGAPGNFSISDHDGPHAHMISADPTGRWVLVNDLGLDRTFIWRLDPQSGQLAAGNPPFIPAASAGAGPRHFGWHPNGRIFYNLYEEASELAVYDWDPRTAALQLKQKVSILPPGYAGTNYASELVIAPNGRFIYAGNRLHNSIG
ncbi:MAG: lactonase family protein, partial [Acetobacteraceae bacterium]